MFEYGDDHDILVFNDRVDEWCYDKSEIFIKTFKELISDDKYAHEIALSIASDVWDGDHSEILDDYNLSEIDALCYLHIKTDKYKKDIMDAYHDSVTSQISHDD